MNSHSRRTFLKHSSGLAAGLFVGPRLVRGAAPDIEVTETKVISLDEIKDEDWTLNISRYVLPPIGEHILPLPEAVAAFKQALQLLGLWQR